MQLAGWLIGFPIFIIAPCAIAVWLGSRVRNPLAAFFLAWLTTPLASAAITIALVPLLRALMPPNNDGTGALMLPFLGIATGILAGIVAGNLVRRKARQRIAAASPPSPDALPPTH